MMLRARMMRGRVHALAWLMAVTALACQDSDADADAAADSATAAVPAAPADPVATVMIQEPLDGADVIGDRVTIVLVGQNIQVAPAGDSTPGTGHHHLFINTPIVNPGEAIPANLPNIVHLGKAQTTHELTGLKSGDYTVIAVLGDLVHRRIDPQVTDTVRFRVR